MYAGARAPEAWIRPNATKIAGYPLYSRFDLKAREYRLSFRPSRGGSELSRQTEIFIPRIHLNDVEKLQITHHGVKASWRLDLDTQTLYFNHEHMECGEQGGTCEISILFRSSRQSRTDIWNRKTVIAIVLCLAVLCRSIKMYI